MMWLVKVHTCTCSHLPSQSRSLVGSFNPFRVKVIVYMYDSITIFLIVLDLFFVGLVLVLGFLPREVPLVFVVKLGLVLNFLNFRLAGKLLISLLNLNESLAR